MKTVTLIMFFLLSPAAVGAGMRTVEYERHEFRGEPERRSGKLSVFVYDIPYFGACGVFPPIHIINEIFLSGGSQGGMSPGATWKPFNISSEEYESLVLAIDNLDPKSIGDKARYAWPKFIFDKTFDHIESWEEWLVSVCEKHRESYHQRKNGS